MLQFDTLVGSHSEHDGSRRLEETQSHPSIQNIMTSQITRNQQSGINPIEVHMTT